MPGLPAELDGLRIAHLSDFHLGVPSPGIGARVAARRRLGARAAARSRRGHRRPAHAPARRAAAARARRAAAAADVRGARQPRRRDQRATRRRGRRTSRELEPATLLRDEGELARAARPDGSGSRASTRACRPRHAAGSTRTSSLAASCRLLRSCSATTRASSTCSSRAASTSCSSGHMHDGQICRAVSGRQAPARAPDARAYSVGHLPRRPRRRCTSRRGSARRSSRSASRRGPRRRSWCYVRASMTGRAGVDLDRHPRALRRRRGARGRGRARARRAAAACSIADANGGVRDRAPPRRRLGRLDPRRSAAPCRRACASTSRAWPTSSRRRSTSSSTRSGRA